MLSRAHLVLARALDDPVHHARQAVRLYEEMCTNPYNPPTAKQLESKDALVKDAKRVLAEAIARVEATDEEGEQDDVVDDDIKEENEMEEYEAEFGIEGVKKKEKGSRVESQEMLLTTWEDMERRAAREMESWPRARTTAPLPNLPTPPRSRGHDGTGADLAG